MTTSTIHTFHIEILRISDLCLAFLGVYHVRSFDSIVVRVDPKHVFRFRIKIDSLHPFLVVYHVHLLFRMQIVGPELWSIGEEYNDVLVLGAADTTLAV